MTIGWVYVAVTESFPGDCKIGFTLGPVEIRMAQLQRQYRTRHRFTAHAAWLVKHPRKVEWLAHKRLGSHRTPRTELFECSAEMGKAAVLWAIDQVIDEERQNPATVTPRPERAAKRWRRARHSYQEVHVAFLLAALLVALLAFAGPQVPDWLPAPAARAALWIETLAAGQHYPESD